MGTYISRTCAEDQSNESPRPLSDYRDPCVSYVLLGEPGAGKTECFLEEKKQPACEYIEARKFARTKDLDQWKDRTLFIDGLDEMRAGGGDGRIPLEDICSKLKELGNPLFRISCREADWLGAIDQQELINAAPGRALKVLRLQPLSDQEIQILVAEKLGQKSEEFIEQARKVGLFELLPNPLNLKMLIEAVLDGNWPKSRKEAYELACRKLVAETNEGHQLAVAGNMASEEKLLESTGLLATCHLLGNLSGYALLPAKADELNPPVTNLQIDESLRLKDALKSRLFKNEGDGHRAPDHRSSAEFLAARYLHSLIRHPDNALPWYRLLALIAASDGKPVSSLRGLWAWLASFLDEPQRYHLIDLDPVAVALYGDVRPWPAKDKERLLTSLHTAAQRYPWIFGGTWMLSPLGALATPDMTETFRSILASEDRSEAKQAQVDCVLNALKYGERLIALVDVLELIVRDTSRWPVIRKGALRAWLHVASPQDADAVNFMTLLSDIHTDKVEDADDELLGLLLEKLYPKYIPPTEVLNYLHARKQRNLIGSYHMFWAKSLVKQSVKANEAILLLLDKLAQKREMLSHERHEHPVHDIAGPLLLKGVIEYGEQVSPARLYEWLGIGLDQHGFTQTQIQSQEIADWLSKHSEVYKGVLAEGIHRAPTDEKKLSNYFSYAWDQRLYGAKPPSDLGLWILSQVENAKPDIAGLLFPEAVRCLWSTYGNEGLSLDRLQSWVEHHPAFQPALTNMLYCEIPDWRNEHIQKTQEWKGKSAKERAQWLKFFSEQQRSLQVGSAHPHVLYDLAMAYSGLLIEARGDTPHDRLRNFLSDENRSQDYEALFQAALVALRGSLGRNDLPTVKDIVQLSLKSKQHLISRSCLVAANELSAEALLSKNDTVLGKLTAMQLTLGVGENPEWFRTLKCTRPELVAQVLMQYALPTLRSKRPSVSGLYGLAYDDDDAAIAAIAVPELLKGFPLRAAKEQHHDLEYLLKAGLKFMATDELLALVEQKLSLKSLEAGQRTLWLITGLFLNPTLFQARLEKHVGKNQTRAALVAGFFPSHGDKWPFHRPLPVPALAWLIGLLGARCAPYRLDGFRWVSPVMAMADLVRSLISGLGSMPGEEASAALNRLFSRNDMAAWHNELRFAIHGQATVQRETDFKYPSVEKILHTLSNREPSSAADLAALALDHLNALAQRVRDGSDNEYRSYWNNPDDPNTAKRRSEDDCRNLLLKDLSLLLKPFGASARKEESVVENNRADIGVFFDGYFVPIEIKADDEKNLWTSLHTQLIDQYTRDPRTNGYGIYLVFWFGGKRMPPPPTGGKPQNAQQLADRLRKLLNPEDRQRIHVCVIDCTLPSRVKS
ncbi:MAG: hypothetical protein FIA96_03235 [Betaproteobacteria bacterium]|nr:hypothetical protein [Betaproteobacteria bacterium]